MFSETKIMTLHLLLSLPANFKTHLEWDATHDHKGLLFDLNVNFLHKNINKFSIKERGQSGKMVDHFGFNYFSFLIKEKPRRGIENSTKKHYLGNILK
jgi:hypothetical protein